MTNKGERLSIFLDRITFRLYRTRDNSGALEIGLAGINALKVMLAETITGQESWNEGTKRILID